MQPEAEAKPEAKAEATADTKAGAKPSAIANGEASKAEKKAEEKGAKGLPSLSKPKPGKKAVDAADKAPAVSFEMSDQLV